MLPASSRAAARALRALADDAARAYARPLASGSRSAWTGPGNRDDERPRRSGRRVVEISESLAKALEKTRFPPRGQGADHRFVAPDEASQRALAAADAAGDEGERIEIAGPVFAEGAGVAGGAVPAPAPSSASAGDALPSASEAELSALKEVLDAYFAATDEAAPEVDGIDDDGRTLLEALRGALAEQLGESDVETINSAPLGRLPWEVLGVDEERGHVSYGVDLTDGKASDPWRNARLSDDAKDAMYELATRDPAVYTTARLAELFRVREQRVAAILALKELEAAKLAELEEEAAELAEGSAEGPAATADADVAAAAAADAAGAEGEEASPPPPPPAAPAAPPASTSEGYLTGSGERRVVTLPSYPNYRQVDLGLFARRLEEHLGVPMADISESMITPEVARAVVGAASTSLIEERTSAAEEASAVAEFKARLAYNLGKTGAGIQRGSRSASAPRRPAEGWSLVVRDLSGGGRGEEGAFVARPDGSRRELSEGEALYQRRQTPLPRRNVF